jgi:hypothetical protein
MRVSTALAWAFLLVLPAALRTIAKPHADAARDSASTWSTDNIVYVPGGEARKPPSYLKMCRTERTVLHSAYMKGDAAAKAWLRNEGPADFEKE